MTVLMLGWEYPPNISGGLGVACQGLAEGLDSVGVKVIFVTPTSAGVHNEHESNIRFIAISDLEIGELETSVSSTVNRHEREVSEVIPELEHLSPYEVNHISLNSDRIEYWNEPLFVEESSVKRKRSRTLKGGYGPNLFTEVQYYTNVITQLVNQLEFDIIHAHDWITFQAGIAIKEITGKPLVVHFHATEFDRAGESGSADVYNIEREAVAKADITVAVSNWTARILIQRYSAHANNLRVVHNGVKLLDESIARTVSPFGNKLITFLGRITFQKGPEYFVRAAKKVAEQFPDCHFVMAGSGDALPRMIRMVADNRMSSKFHFTGFLNSEEMRELLSMSTAYVMPSVSEPFGITPLEAVQAGVPVVISRQSGVSEVIGDVLKIDFWNVDELSEAICNIINHQSLSRSLSSNAKERIKEISWQTAANKIKQIYYENSTGK